MGLFTSIALGLAAAGMAGSSIYSASKQPKSPSIDLPKLQDVVKTPSESKAAETASEAVLQKRRAVAKQKTIFTSPLGIGQDATIARKTLLGQ